jgi:hypothetical protein
LQSINSISNVELSVEGIVVTPSTPQVDPRPDIARTIVSGGWNLVELRPLAVNLEEIFLELTRQEVVESAEEEMEAEEVVQQEEAAQ